MATAERETVVAAVAVAAVAALATAERETVVAAVAVAAVAAGLAGAVGTAAGLSRSLLES